MNMPATSCDPAAVTSSNTPSRRRRLTVVGLPHSTSEILWDGHQALPFILKRKRNGAIQVAKVKDTCDVRVGSELKLVSGFPVQHLTLPEVKKVLLKAPKPVSLVFMHHEEMVLDERSQSIVSRDDYERVSSSSWNDADLTSFRSTELLRSESIGTTSTRSSSNGSEEDVKRPIQSMRRQPSRLQSALARMNQLLNRPVRQSALNMAAGKSIVV